MYRDLCTCSFDVKFKLLVYMIILSFVTPEKSLGPFIRDDGIAQLDAVCVCAGRADNQ